MKHRVKYWVLTVVLGFVIALTGEAAPSKNELVWIVEPTLSYNIIFYCQDCDLFNQYEFKRETNLSDMGAKLNELISKFDYDSENLYLSGGHGGGETDYKYDEKKGLYGYYYTDEGDSEFIMRQRNDFFQEPDHVNKPLAFKKIDSDKVKTFIDEVYNTDYDFSDAQIGDKYAVAYNGTFVTDFIYDERDKNTASDKIALKLGDKWGVLDKDGNTLIPFEFDHITFIDDDAAFAKYNGKYGILNVKRTAAE